MVVWMSTLFMLYAMELNLDKCADYAMRQVDLRDYPDSFALCGLPIVKVVSFFN